MFIQSKKKLIKSGLAVGLLFNLIFFIFPLLIKNQTNYVVLVISLLIILISFFRPYLLRYPLEYWMKFGNLAAKINSTIILGIFFYFLILPFSFVRFIIKKLTLFRNSDQESYYIRTEGRTSSNLKDQY